MEVQQKVNEQMKTANLRREQNSKGNKVSSSGSLVVKTSNMIRMVNVWFLVLVTKIINRKIANTQRKQQLLLTLLEERR